MTLLTYHSKYVIQSGTAVTTSGSTIVNDTQASQAFTLLESHTVLAMYVANSAYGDSNARILKNAINVDGTDYSVSTDGGNSTSTPRRNTCFWIGTLAAGDHTIKGRFAGYFGETSTVSNRTLLIFILNGDEFQYIYNTTVVSTTSASYVDDQYAQTTLTPSDNCKALILYSVENDYLSSEPTAGKKICINVEGVDYTDCEAAKSGVSGSYRTDSILTAYSLPLTSSSTTFKGRYASASSGTVTISKSVIGVLLFNPTTELDILYSDTQTSNTSTSLINDTSDVTITRNIAGELLVLASATKNNGTSGTTYGLEYGLNVDSTDIVVSRSSPQGATTPESNFVVYAETVASGEHTINGRFAVNYSTTAAVVDHRIIIALWFPTALLYKKIFSSDSDIDITKTISSVTALDVYKHFTSYSTIFALLNRSNSSDSDICIQDAFSTNNNLKISRQAASFNDLILFTSVSTINDLCISNLQESLNNISVQKQFSDLNNIYTNKTCSTSNDIDLVTLFGSSNKILTTLLTKLFATSNDIRLLKYTGTSNDISAWKIVFNYNNLYTAQQTATTNDIGLSKLFISSNAIISVILQKLFSTSNNIQLKTLFQDATDIKITNVVSSDSDIKISKIISSNSDILAIIEILDYNFPLTVIVSKLNRTITISKILRTATIEPVINRTVTIDQ